MKTILFVLLILMASCEMPIGKGTSPGPSNTSEAPGKPTSPEIPIYIPPFHDGMKEINVLRAPSGMVASRTIVRVIAQDDPLYGVCNEPGSIYMFYSLGALVQYKPEDGNYTLYSLAFKGDVERHNATYPSDTWDIKTVSMPGHVFDFSHDPEPKALTMRFLNNSGELAEHPNVPGYIMDYTFTLDDYHTFVGPDGRPKQILQTDFEGWGANDGVHVFHMQLGGDGISIPPYTFHF